MQVGLNLLRRWKCWMLTSWVNIQCPTFKAYLLQYFCDYHVAISGVVTEGKSTVIIDWSVLKGRFGVCNRLFSWLIPDGLAWKSELSICWYWSELEYWLTAGDHLPQPHGYHSIKIHSLVHVIWATVLAFCKTVLDQPHIMKYVLLIILTLICITKFTPWVL